MKKQKKKILKKGILFMVLAGVLYTCKIPLPTFVASPYDVYLTTPERVVKKQRSIWYYQPLTKQLLIEDSVRSISFKVKDAFVYSPSRVYQTYFWFFMPWADIYNASDYQFLTIRFEHIDFKQLMDRTHGIWFRVGDAEHDQIFSGGPVWWDEKKEGTSFYGERLSNELPDTLYFKIWGRKDLFFTANEYYQKTLDERIEISRLANKKEIVELGVIPFVKGDSILFAPKKEDEFKPVWAVW